MTVPSFIPMNAVASTPRVQVTFRVGPCKCGCGGQDSQHRASAARTLRGLRVLPEPLPFRRPDGRACEHRQIVAEAQVRAPWGEDVIAVAVARGGLVSWEIAR